MTRPLAVALLVLVGLALLALMWWGWRRRVRRTAVGLGAPAAALTAPVTLAVEGVYVSSTTAGEWLERIAADGLGVRSPVVAEVGDDGVTLRRTGAPDVVVPRAALLGARTERGIAGKVAQPGGIVVLRWRTGDVVLDTGVHPRHAADRARLVDAINAITPPPVGEPTAATAPGAPDSPGSLGAPDPSSARSQEDVA
ncbi:MULTISPECIES: ABC transporter permease [Miniimonas]|nr:MULTISPECIES: ABC transporter permease [Miniimonas]